MSAELENSASGDASVSSSGPAPAPVPTKKKRSLPGMPDPDAEVIALSPKTLMATNRFVCEICNKGFQRDQNLQLHRRGHNLPWKLRQRSGKEVRKRVYVCPEPSCVHHDPSRALGDLTGIKKHFCRKHGEKKWKCDKCAKKYAVQSDWKAHLKTCGTREYRCDCGTLFSRRDSFITHRAFCDALAEESAKAQTTVANSTAEEPKQQHKITAPACGVLPAQQGETENGNDVANQIQMPQLPMGRIGSSGSSDGSNTSLFAGLYASPAAAPTGTGSIQPQSSAFSDLIGAMTQPDRATTTAPSTSTEPPSLCLSSNGSPTLFSPQDRRQLAPLQPPHMSATALLQKAAQMGAAATNSSLYRGFGLGLPSPPTAPENMQWQQRAEVEPASEGLGLGLPGIGLSELMMGQSIFGAKPATLDLFGLGMGMGGGAAPGGLSALITSIGGGFDVTASFGGGAANSPGKS